MESGHFFFMQRDINNVTINYIQYCCAYSEGFSSLLFEISPC